VGTHLHRPQPDQAAGRQGGLNRHRPAAATSSLAPPCRATPHPPVTLVKPPHFPDGLLGVPTRVLEQEPEVDDLSLRFRNSAWAFILAHELGHLRHRHPGNAAVDPATSQAHEVEADRFALDLLGRSDTPNRADFKTERQFLNWQRAEATHPMNPGRLQAMALQLDRAASRTLNPSHAEVLRFIATRLASIGDILAEPDMQRLIARQAVLGDLEDLRRR
jgi:hypothetical protein